MNFQKKQFQRYLDYLEKEKEFPSSFRLRTVKCQSKTFTSRVISQKDYEKLKQGLRREENWFWYFLVRVMACTGVRERRCLGLIFTGKNGKPLTARSINRKLKVFARRYRIPPETMTPHSFRHRFAQNFLAQYNDITLLADLLGHSSLRTTRIYLTRSEKEQWEEVDRIVTW